MQSNGGKVILKIVNRFFDQEQINKSYRNDFTKTSYFPENHEYIIKD